MSCLIISRTELFLCLRVVFLCSVFSAAVPAVSYADVSFIVFPGTTTAANVALFMLLYALPWFLPCWNS